MSDLIQKRQLTEELFDDSLESELKRQEDNNKKFNKPGRKPLDTEPKNKRTAQNRAAQRAFRERKERKMKELEDKVLSLEDEKNSATTESEFLRIQVQMLMNELAKHRGTNDISDLNLPKFDSNVKFKNQSIIDRDDDDSKNSSPNLDSDFSNQDRSSSISNNSQKSNDESSPSINSKFSFKFPWSRKNSSINNTNTNTNNSPQISPNFNTNTSSHSNSLPGLAPDSSTSSSSCDSSPFELYNNDDETSLPLFNNKGDDGLISKQQLQLQKQENDFNFNQHFDEGVSDFCNDLNSACGTKNAPIPKSKISTPFLSNNVEINKPEDSLSFFNDQNFNGYVFDPNLAFITEDSGINDLFDDNEFNNNNINKSNIDEDPILKLTTEESIYDPFGIFQEGGNNNNNSNDKNLSPILEKRESISNSKDSNKKESLESSVLEEIVPNKEGNMLKCTEIWDRITSHPKYSDIDIDGLCSELRAKAKCSDKGVVIDYSDVSNVIKNNIPYEQ
ncbi:hypothetical protein WICMUC_003715 [Wickerhamomyces mucosus]|uniref:BZIP domain-containing protein n=1 Tax=Wickerhamomyces mucosus TaxID=1378264 RepID=A0A9P8PJN6_9ASCO|nr:hypothetical protein WICMUC_003715 [Wickerhamomyces mucosus]